MTNDDARVREEGRFAITCIVNLAHAMALAGRAVTIDVDVQDSDEQAAKVRVTLSLEAQRKDAT